MRFRLLTVAGITAAAGMLLTGCSSSDSTASPGPTQTSTTVPSTSVTATTTSAADSTTTNACRSLADNEDLKEFWHEVNNSPAVTGALAMRAGMAVMQLGVYADDTAVDPTVASAMSTAVTEMGNMNQEIADNSATFDIERFRGIVTPVVDACLDAGVDMAVTE